MVTSRVLALQHVGKAGDRLVETKRREEDHHALEAVLLVEDVGEGSGIAQHRAGGVIQTNVGNEVNRIGHNYVGKREVNGRVVDGGVLVEDLDVFQCYNRFGLLAVSSLPSLPLRSVLQKMLTMPVTSSTSKQSKYTKYTHICGEINLKVFFYFFIKYDRGNRKTMIQDFGSF